MKGGTGPRARTPRGRSLPDRRRAGRTLLRYLSVPTALEDIDLGGEVISANESVAVNRDPSRFTDPNLVTFGQQLARVDTRTAYTALLRRFAALKLAVLPEEVPMRTDR